MTCAMSSSYSDCDPWVCVAPAESTRTAARRQDQDAIKFHRVRYWGYPRSPGQKRPHRSAPPRPGRHHVSSVTILGVSPQPRAETPGKYSETLDLFRSGSGSLARMTLLFLCGLKLSCWCNFVTRTRKRKRYATLRQKNRLEKRSCP